MLRQQKTPARNISIKENLCNGYTIPKRGKRKIDALL
jgi:hypothetical protein